MLYKHSGNRIRLFFKLSLFLLYFLIACDAGEEIAIKNEKVQIKWRNSHEGWQIQQVKIKSGSGWIEAGKPSGAYWAIYSERQPVDEQQARNDFFSESHIPLNSVESNSIGKTIQFYPTDYESTKKNAITFIHENEDIELRAHWTIDPIWEQDIRVSLHYTVKKPGYYSVATPTLTAFNEEEIEWGMIPGFLYGNKVEKDMELAWRYGWGIPDQPVLARERTTTTLSPLLSSKRNVNLAVIPDPGSGRDPWTEDRNTHDMWKLGLSLMNRSGELSPTAYSPVLGEEGSLLNQGDTLSFSFRYSLSTGNWFETYKHAMYDIYRFPEFLDKKKTGESLSQRVEAMHTYVKDDETSLWRTDRFEDLEIGGQEYHGAVKEADGDAMKNSDLGAMWMLAEITGDPVLQEKRLPYVRNFKLKQQQEQPGFFQGAALGQYYLYKSDRFVEEWGTHLEPISLTYYTMIDLGNILLFEPEDKELRERLRLGAERLLSWQFPDGHWEVAYDRETKKPIYNKLTDLRPTWYGLLVAYRVLKEEKYLDAAKKGADWFLEQAVSNGRYLGVCGDAHFIMDFATGQSAQALLDIYQLTSEQRYLDGAIEAAKVYTTWIYTHPIPSEKTKIVNGIKRQDWEISQVGLNMEHGGSRGSATRRGPILLCSHAGMFMRFFKLTGEEMFRDMARAAALGRDAFVDPETHVASYYWSSMNNGPGPFPHHAWWQIGWIMDYILSEAMVRSDNKISFPGGFVTPKVGPNKPYGFESGTIYGKNVKLWMPVGLIKSSSPYIDYFGAVEQDEKTLYIVLLNEDNKKLNTTIKVDSKLLFTDQLVEWQKVKVIKGTAELKVLESGTWSVHLEPYGLVVLALDY